MKKSLLALTAVALLFAGCGEGPVNVPGMPEVVGLPKEATSSEGVTEDDESNAPKRIICWGDSVTEGTGGDGISYPSVVAEMSGYEVLNYGVYNERASMIAARQGANPQHVENLSEIPAKTEPVKVDIVGDNGKWEMWCNFGDAGINPCEIAGVKGTLSIDPDDGTRYFTRNEPGAVVPLNGKEKFTTFAMTDKRDSDILILWTGCADGWDEDKNIEDIIKYQKAMLEYSNCTEYIVINYTGKLNIGEIIDDWNIRLEEEYGEHYLDLRGFILNDALKEAGITPTKQDQTDIEGGFIPESLRSDDVGHFNAIGYRLIGEQVYNKLLELGYI